MTAALLATLTTIGPWALVVLAAILVIETSLPVGFLLPGDTLLVGAGLLVAQGALSIPWWTLMLVTIAAAATGNQLGYLLGRGMGRLLPDADRVRGHRHRVAASRLLETHGDSAVILARFIPLARTFVPLLAGAQRMDPKTFTRANVVGAVAWVGLLFPLGYFFGGVPLLANHIELVLLGLILVWLAPLAATGLIRRRRAQAPDRESLHDDAQTSQIDASVSAAV